MRHEPDVSVADWFINADADWAVLASQGPPGYESYATVWVYDPEWEDTEWDDPESEPDVYRIVFDTAVDHTSSHEAIFGLWEGDGNMGGGFTMRFKADRLQEDRRPPQSFRDEDVILTERPHAFDQTIRNGPKADLGRARAYFLFAGPMAELGRWPMQAAPDGTEFMPSHPAIAWPEDRAWFIALDVDPCALTIGGSQALIDEVLAHPDLHAKPAIYGVTPPEDCADR